VIFQINQYRIKKEAAYSDLIAILSKLKQYNYKKATIADLDLVKAKLEYLKGKGYSEINGSSIDNLTYSHD
jgi:hypothetical protein